MKEKIEQLKKDYIEADKEAEMIESKYSKSSIPIADRIILSYLKEKMNKILNKLGSLEDC